VDIILGVTGHRPNALSGYSPEAFDLLAFFAARQLRKVKPKHVNTGMAMGWDLAVARACVKLKIPYTAYIPFPHQSAYWNVYWKQQWEIYYKLADTVVIEYTVQQLAVLSSNKKVAIVCALDARNHSVVDNSNLMLAMYAGISGGTANCLSYAESKGIKHLNVYETFLKFTNFMEG